MNMWVKIYFLSGGMKCHNHAGRAGNVFANVSFPSCPGGLVKNGVKFAIKFEINPKAFWYGKYQVPLRVGE